MEDSLLTEANRPSERSSILLVGSQMETGGSQRNLFSQAAWFHQHGHQVKVVFLYDKEGLHESWQSLYAFPIINLNARRLGAGHIEAALRLLAGLLRGIKLVIWSQLAPVRRFDVIETFTHHPTLMMMPIAWAAGIPLRIASHRGRIRDFPHILEKIHAWMINSRLVTAMVAVSEQVRLQSMEEGINTEKIVVIPNGLEIPSELNDANKQALRLNLCGSLTTALVISVGRMNREKGHDLLIEAIPSILQNQPDTCFIFAGDGYDRLKLEALVNTLDIQNQVKFLGIRKDAVKLMAACDIFVLPSRSEGMPNALLEAMGTGMAVVSYDVGGVSEVIHHGKNGLLVPPENTHILADTIITLLQNTPLRDRLGAKATETVMQSYSLESMCQKYSNLIHDASHKD